MAMSGLKNWVLLLLFLPPFFHFPCINADAYRADFSSANVSASWKNNPSNKRGSLESYDYILRPILLVPDNKNSYPPFGLGFFTNTTSSISASANSFYLVVFMLTDFFDGEAHYNPNYPPRVLWSANRDKPVREDATLDFTTEGELILKDADGGDPVWSTKTSGHSVARMEVTVGGNLMLLDDRNSVVWQSFDHPTDTWLPNQRIYNGQRIIAQNSSSNLSTGMYYLSVTKEGMHAFLDSNPPKQYALLFGEELVGDESIGYPSTDFGDIDMYNGIYHFKTYVKFQFNLSTPEFRYIVLEPSGQLLLYRVEKNVFGFFARPSVDILSYFQDGCTYPTVCGSYGVCLAGEQCTCPMEHNGNSYYYFSPFEPNVGCAEITPLSCRDGSKSHTFVELSNFTYLDFVPMFLNTSLQKCKEACLNNCPCKAAFFRYDENVSSGNCSLQLDEILYSFRKVNFNSYALIKVHKMPDLKMPDLKKPAASNLNLVLVLVPSLFGGLVFLVVGTCYGHRMLKNRDDAEEECDDQVTEALTKFSFEELKLRTQNFQAKLGQGGFGSVFEGVLCDGNGTKVAVKWLDSIGQGKKEFLAEVNTIGKVDHFNLVRLIGYCAEKSNRLLVYEYMCHGSLDQWIFNLDKAKTLGSEIRQKIIYGVAKGLEYLHEECNRKIIHFDIKPQNILLDGDFNAKISDFGLAKLIDRNQSLVLTVLRGTPGYLAPELFGGSNISVKADVYSFGIVILETVCGRKNLDSSESRRLINIVKAKAEEDQLYDLINECNEDIWCHKEEAVKMIKIGLWCLQTHDRRPSISMVVKVLEGSADMDQITDHHFLTMSHIDSPILVNPNIQSHQRLQFSQDPDDVHVNLLCG